MRCARARMVLDMSGALDEEPGVLVRAPWLQERSGDGRNGRRIC